MRSIRAARSRWVRSGSESAEQTVAKSTDDNAKGPSSERPGREGRGTGWPYSASLA